MAGVRKIDLGKLIDNISQDVIDALNVVLAAEANKMVQDMRARARKKSGVMAETIHAESPTWKANKLGVTIKAGGKATTKEVRKGSGVSYDYSHANEWGTHKMPAYPFFFNTYRKDRAKAKRAIKASILGGMRKAVARGQIYR